MIRERVLYENSIKLTSPPLGASIELVDGTFVKVNLWESDMIANSVAFNDGINKIKLALNDVSGKYLWGEYELVPVVTKSDYTAAGTDYEGKANTDILVNYWYSHAAHAARGYTFHNGQLGYLPGGGEFMLYVNNKNAINACLSAAGGAELNLSSDDSFYWTSTQISLLYAWIWNYYTLRLNISDKYGTAPVRPFAEFLPSQQ